MISSSNWSKVYSDDGRFGGYAADEAVRSQRYDQYCQCNREYYRQIPEQAYENIEKCVKHAIEYGNHAAFVHYFVQHAYFSKEMFAEQFEMHIDQWKKQYGTKEKQLKLLKDDYWRSPGFCCNREDLNVYAYKPGMISGWKSRSSQIVPAKNVIVQLGLYFQLDSNQVNALLLLAGRD